jgi:hypothetical protein
LCVGEKGVVDEVAPRAAVQAPHALGLASGPCQQQRARQWTLPAAEGSPVDPASSRGLASGPCQQQRARQWTLPAAEGSPGDPAQHLSLPLMSALDRIEHGTRYTVLLHGTRYIVPSSCLRCTAVPPAVSSCLRSTSTASTCSRHRARPARAVGHGRPGQPAGHGPWACSRLRAPWPLGPLGPAPPARHGRMPGHDAGPWEGPWDQAPRGTRRDPAGYPSPQTESAAPNAFAAALPVAPRSFKHS